MRNHHVGYHLLVAVLLGALIFSACQEDEPAPQPPPPSTELDQA